MALKAEKNTWLGRMKSKLESFYVINLLGFDPMKLCVLTLVFEGLKDQVDNQEKRLYALAKKYNALIGD